MAPWLVAAGSELEIKSSLPEVQVRARSVNHGKTGIVLVSNTTAEPHYLAISVPQLPAEELKGLFDHHAFKPVKNRFTEKLGPYDTRAYTWGNEPQDSR
jgi:hypothetical protein